MTTKLGGKQGRGLTTGIPERTPALLHYVVVRHGEKGLELLRIRLEGKGEVLPVFSAAWASRGYLFAEAPGGGWYVSTYTPGELISLLFGPCVGVEWVRGGVRDPCGDEDEVFATTTIGSTAVLRPLYLDSWLPFTYWIRTDSDGFAVDCTRKVSIRVGTVCGPCKHWRRERRHYRHVRG